jgi:predicted ArsR family transcriptional regulator
MPSRVNASAIPDDASRARKGIDGTSRTLVLRYLMGAPDSTQPEVAEHTGISPAAARLALGDLEQLGYVKANIERPRKGRLVRYAAVRGAFSEDLEALTSWLLS